jgi:hypothetical protein
MSAPSLVKATTIQGVRDGVCRWFGGPYDPNTRSYRTPQVENLGAVRRARAKREDDADFFLGQPAAGALMGSQLWVHADSGKEWRVAVAGRHGMKECTSAVMLHVFLRSYAEWAEDAQDAFYELQEALLARIREDPALGSGGFENGGFDIDVDGLRWAMAPAETSAELTTSYLFVEFQARYFKEG